MISVSHKNKTWDIVIVGTGMGGGTLGYELARSGYEVLFIEKGNVERPCRLTHERPHTNTKEKSLFLQGRHWENIFFSDKVSTDIFVPHLGSGIGGSSALYGMALERFLPSDFTPKKNFLNTRLSTIPEEWPITYDEMVPWYLKAEKLYGVRGTSDPIQKTYSSFTSHGEPEPLSKANKWLFDHLTMNRLNPYQIHLAYDNISNCPQCQDHLCKFGCKNDAAKVCIKPAINNYSAEIIGRCEGKHLGIENNKAKRLICNLDGKTISIKAKLFVVACGALETPILLHNTDCLLKNTPINNSGMLGKNLMRHLIVLFSVNSPESDVGSQVKQISLNDFYTFEGERYGNLQSLGSHPPISQIAHLGFNRSFLKNNNPLIFLNQIVQYGFNKYILGNNNSLILAAIIEDQPYLYNSVSSTKNNKARWKLNYSVSKADNTRVQRMIYQVKKTLPHNTQVIDFSNNHRMLAHICGTCRFGKDSETSILNKNNRIHNLDNVFVVDSSFFPSSSGTNP
ncbi:hypothetical protein LCGC14_1969770, partial [marine sediment metagenome]